MGDTDGEAIIGPIIANRSPRRRFYLYAACVALVLGTGASVMHWRASMGRPNALGPPLRPDVIVATDVSASAGPAVDGGQTSGASQEQVSPPVGSAERPAPQSSLSRSDVMTPMAAPPAAALPSPASQTDPGNAAPATNAPDPHGTNAAQAPASEVPTESAVAVPAQAQTLPDVHRDRFRRHDDGHCRGGAGGGNGFRRACDWRAHRPAFRARERDTGGSPCVSGSRRRRPNLRCPGDGQRQRGGGRCYVASRGRHTKNASRHRPG